MESDEFLGDHSCFWWLLTYFSRAAEGIKKKKGKLFIHILCCKMVLLHQGFVSIYNQCFQHDSPEHFHRIQLFLRLQWKLKRVLSDSSFSRLSKAKPEAASQSNQFLQCFVLTLEDHLATRRVREVNDVWSEAEVMTVITQTQTDKMSSEMPRGPNLMTSRVTGFQFSAM